MRAANSSEPVALGAQAAPAREQSQLTPGIKRRNALPMSFMEADYPVRGEAMAGTGEDGAGAVVSGARIEITGDDLSQPLLLTSDESGKFVAAKLNAGKYSIRVAKEGFDDLVTTVDLRGSADLALDLAISAQQTSVTVTEKSTAFANSHAVYLQLRKGGLGDTLRCDNFILPIDVAPCEFTSGTLTFLAKLSTFETGAVFFGQGHFTLKPVVAIDNNEKVRSSRSTTADEDCKEA